MSVCRKGRLVHVSEECVVHYHYEVIKGGNKYMKMFPKMLQNHCSSAFSGKTGTDNLYINYSAIVNKYASAGVYLYIPPATLKILQDFQLSFRGFFFTPEGSMLEVALMIENYSLAKTTVTPRTPKLLE